MLTHKHCRVAEPSAGRADRVVQALTGLTRKQVTGLFDAGCVTVNGAPCQRDFTPVAAGDLVDVRYDPHTRYHPSPRAWQDPTFRPVFEDQHLLVVDKAAWVMSVPTEAAASKGKTLVDHVTQYLRRGAAQGPVAYVVHRLDRGTSGLLVFGKTYKVAQLIKNQFAAHKPRREYWALVAGDVAANEGTFRSHLATAPNLSRYSIDPRKSPAGTPGQDRSGRPEPTGAEASPGDLAITHYRVDRRINGATFVRCRLETGKRHQIRVHFAESGHPVLGDERYRPDLGLVTGWKFRRLALHAGTLEFVHPISGELLHFDSPLPREFAQVLQRGSAGRPIKEVEKMTDGGGTAPTGKKRFTPQVPRGPGRKRPQRRRSPVQ